MQVMIMIKIVLIVRQSKDLWYSVIVLISLLLQRGQIIGFIGKVFDLF